MGLWVEFGVLYYDLWCEVDGEWWFVFNELYVDEVVIEVYWVFDYYKVFGFVVCDLMVGWLSVVVMYVVLVVD